MRFGTLTRNEAQVKPLHAPRTSPYLKGQGEDMTYIRWTFRILILLLLGGILHYNLPQRDIVQIVGTYEERQDFGGFKDFFWKNTGDATSDAPITRDVQFIQTVRENGDPSVYRNQDTGLGWPPYFKFDTADLQTRAVDAVSSPDNPTWVAVRHYGWRSTWLGGGIFPNATSLKVVSGPDERLIPWFNIVFLVVLAIALITIWRLWRNFWARRVDPVLEDIDDAGTAAKSKFWKVFGRS